ncbi:hypothetical protein [Hyphomonas sp.]|uniref:hypothetical protein n=1 Tax=Hyphomonas sp. TaxID=87 RepID=UPI0032D8FE37
MTKPDIIRPQINDLAEAHAGLDLPVDDHMQLEMEFLDGDRQIKSLGQERETAPQRIVSFGQAIAAHHGDFEG